MGAARSHAAPLLAAGGGGGAPRGRARGMAGPRSRAAVAAGVAACGLGVAAWFGRCPALRRAARRAAAGLMALAGPLLFRLG